MIMEIRRSSKHIPGIMRFHDLGDISVNYQNHFNIKEL